MSPVRPSGVVLAVSFALLCLIWGTTWSVIQIGLAGIPPLSGVAVRFAIAALLLLSIAAYRKVPLGTGPRERLLWVINGVLAFSASYGILYWSEQWVPSGLAAVLFATYPLFVAILSHFALPAEPLRIREGIGIVVGFAGVGVLFSQDFAQLGGGQVATAAAITLVSPFVSAAASVAVKRWGAGVHPLSLAGVPMGLAAALMGGLAAMLEHQRSFTWNAVSIGALLYLAIIGSAVTFTLYYWLLGHLPVKRMSLIAYVVPVVAVGIGALRGEPLTPPMLAGAALVLCGIALAVQRRRDPPLSRPRPGSAVPRAPRCAPGAPRS